MYEMRGNKSLNQAWVVVFMVLVLVVGINMNMITTIDAAMTPKQCKEERRLLVSGCQELINKKPPSSYCCQRLRVTHLECVCPVITPKLALLVDVNYAARVVRSCGRNLPRHYKCGSITLP